MADTAQRVADRVEVLRTRNAKRDRDYRDIIAIRKGDYDSVAPGLFSSDLKKPLVANLIDTTARDIAEVMAPLPMVTCQSAALSSEADRKRQDLRSCIANSYVQDSRLQDQMFGGADRYGSFGFMAFFVEPDFKEQAPRIRVGTTPTAYYERDALGRTREYVEVYQVTCSTLVQQYGHIDGLYDQLRAKFGSDYGTQTVECARYYGMDEQCVVLLDPCIELVCVPNLTKRCPVRIIERPQLTTDGTRGQFDDVIWVQIARALVQQYTMDAIEQSVHAPITIPKDVQEIEVGPFSAIQTDTPNAVGRVNLGISAGLFPEGATLAQEQRVGSRYPEGRSGSIDASIVTGQGVQALMGTFDTQVQTFQRLCASALEDVIALCFEMDEAAWGGAKKTRQIKQSGAARKFDYIPSKDIAGNHTVDVSYGAIAGLDPNRGLVFVLQALAGGLISKTTGRKSLPVDINVDAEEQQIKMEQLEDSMAAAITQLPLAIPAMAAQGADPRQIVLQLGELHDLLAKGTPVSDALKKVFAPKEEPAPEAPSPLEQAMGAGQGPAALPGAGSGGASDLLMSLAGITPGGRPNLQSNVSRMQPAQG